MRTQLKPLAEQTIAIMGASSGIGRATAKLAAARGANVVVAARSGEGLDSLVEEITRAGGRAVAQPADTTEWDDVRSVVERAERQYGGLDTWVHAAAVTMYAPLEEIEPDEFRRVIDVNLVGQAFGAKAAIPALRRRGGGALVHVSSILGKRSFPLQAAYCASKHGVNGLLESLRVELEHEGLPISVTNVMPATINTPFFDKAGSRIGVRPTGPPPVYQPEAVAEAILSAAQHPVRDVVVGGASALPQLLTQAVAPRVMDLVSLVAGFATQRTDEARPDTAGNLFQPVPGHDTVEGHFGRTRSRSLWSTLATRRPPGVSTLGDALSGAAAAAGRALAKDSPR